MELASTPCRLPCPSCNRWTYSGLAYSSRVRSDALTLASADQVCPPSPPIEQLSSDQPLALPFAIHSCSAVASPIRHSSNTRKTGNNSAVLSFRNQATRAGLCPSP